MNLSPDDHLLEKPAPQRLVSDIANNIYQQRNQRQSASPILIPMQRGRQVLWILFLCSGVTAGFAASWAHKAMGFGFPMDLLITVMVFIVCFVVMGICFTIVGM